MLLSKLKSLLPGALLAAVTLGFAGVLMHGAWAERPAPSKAAEPTPPGKERGGGKKSDRAKDAAARELEALQGDWNVVGLEENGRKAPPEAVKGMRWTFKGDRVLGTDPGKKPAEFARVMKLDPTKDPKQIDLVSLQEGPLKGKTLLGIYKREKGRLIVCVRDVKAAEKGRPTEFTADAGSNQGLVTLEKP